MHPREVVMKRGFTLIELLVVVLIIGVLAAVALPQYQKAVEKSRLSEAVASLTDIMKSEHLYYLENGDFGSDFRELPIVMPNLGSGAAAVYSYDTPNYTISLEDGGSRAKATRNGGAADGHFLTFTIDGMGNVRRYCNDSSTGIQLCDSLRAGGGFESTEYEELVTIPKVVGDNCLSTCGPHNYWTDEYGHCHCGSAPVSPFPHKEIAEP